MVGGAAGKYLGRPISKGDLKEIGEAMASGLPMMSRESMANQGNAAAECAERLIAEGQMTPAGLAAFERRKCYDEALLDARRSERVKLPPEIETKLRSNEAAWKNYTALAPSYRKQYAAWLTQAVKPETRERRLTEALRLLEENRPLGMK